MNDSSFIGIDNQPVSEVFDVKLFRETSLEHERRAVVPLAYWHCDGKPVDDCSLDVSSLRRPTKFEIVEEKIERALVSELTQLFVCVPSSFC